VLEFKPVLGDAPGFERALRTRVAALRDVSPVSLATVIAVEHPEGLGLCLVSEHVPGRRLAELAPEDQGASLALDVLRATTLVLEALNHTGVGVAHGALSSNRIVVAADGGVTVVEHVLGWAVEATGFSRTKLNGLGIVLPAGEPVRFDGRIDMVQLGFLTLSLWLRRHLDPGDCPNKVPELLDEAAAQEESPEFANRLRVWLERAMQIGPRPFASAHDAIDALDELPETNEPDREAEPDWLAFRSEGGSAPKSSPAPTDESGTFDVAHLRAAIEQRHATAEAPAAPVPRITQQTVWILAVLALIAIGEAVAVGLLVAYRHSATATASAELPAVTSPSAPPPASASTDPPAPSDRDSAQAVVGRGSSNAVGSASGSAASTAPRPASGRFGGLTITSALEFLVSADGTPVGTNRTPIALREGSHRLEFVNDALGFRQTRTVTVTSGEMSVVHVAMPTGRISLNATPWAEVSIDGAGVGETPIANYSLPIGPHEVVFHHPELGDRRQSVVVRVGEYVRVTQAFDRWPWQRAK
jgi:hypothetical protein